MEVHKIKISGKVISSVVFVLFSLLTVFSVCFMTLSLMDKEKNNLSLQAKDIAQKINEKINSYIGVTYSVRGLFLASNSVERKEFRDFVLGLQLSERNPGISSVTYVERVLYNDKENFSKEMISDTSTNPIGYPNFKINPDVKKDEYYLGKYVEPESGRSQIFGYDLSSEANRNYALTLARDTDSPVSTAVVTLVTTQKPGLSIFLPIYKNNTSITTVENRRGALVGYAVVAIRVEDFFNGLIRDFSAVNQNSIFEVYDVKQGGKESLFYTYNPHNVDFTNNYSTKIDLDIAGHVWRLAVYDNDSSVLNNSQKFLIIGTLIGGLLISFLISLLVYLLIQGHNNSIELAQKITKDLTVKEEDLLTRTRELEKLNKNMIGRELKMMELKEEINKLKKKTP